MAAESDGDPRVVGGDAPDPPDHIEQSIREIVRDEQEKQAEEQAEQQGRYLARIGLTRRQVLAIAGGSALGGTLLSAFTAERARAAATGEIGTAADPLNILRVANLGGGGVPINVDDHLDLQSSQEIQNAAAVTTDELHTAFAGARIVKTSSQSVSNTGEVQVTFEAASEKNSGADAFADLASDGITIPNSNYSMAQVILSIGFTSQIAIEYIVVKKNGSNFDGGVLYQPSGTSFQSLSFATDWVSVSNNDTFTAYVNHSGGATETIADNDTQTFLSVVAV